MELKNTLKAGDEISIQIAPYGEYPATTVDGKEIIERFDKDSFKKIIDNWKNNGEKMIRADFDHASEMTDNTIASGWIKDLILDNEKGLMGTLVVSDAQRLSSSKEKQKSHLNKTKLEITHLSD